MAVAKSHTKAKCQQLALKCKMYRHLYHEEDAEHFHIFRMNRTQEFLHNISYIK